MTNLNSKLSKKTKLHKYLNQSSFQIYNKKIKISQTLMNSQHHPKNLKIISIQSKVLISLFKIYRRKLVKLLVRK